MINKKIIESVSDSEERLLLAKTIDKANTAIKSYGVEFSAFIDPFKAHKFKDILSSERNVIISLYGGYDSAERLKMGFFSQYIEPNFSEFPITPIEIKYNGKFSSALSHRDFLGSVLGLGITREKVGDIVLIEDGAVVFVDSDIADYIVFNLEKVKRTKVSCNVLENYKPSSATMVEKKFTVASLRLDAVLSHSFNISRGKAAELIKGEKAYLNWKNEVSTSKTVAENDIITLRGYGRIKIIEVIGTTKKDRILLNIGIYK